MVKNLTKKATAKALSVLGLWLVFCHDVYAQQAPVNESVQLINPLKVDSIEELLIAILNVLIVLSIPVIVFFIISSGFLYVTARGNPQQIEQASKSLTFAIIGGVLIIGAVAIAEIVKNIVTSF